MCKYIISLLTLLIMLCSCQYIEKSTDVYEDIYEKYKLIKSYESKINMTVKSNKAVKEYSINQYYKYPDKYRLDVIEPNEISGLKTYYSDNEVSMVHPNVDRKFTLLDYAPLERTYIFLPDFFSLYYKSEQTSVYTAKGLDNKYTILKTSIPGTNIYRHSYNLWIENETLLPHKMEVLDIKGNTVITIKFDTIKLNVDINDNVFKSK